MHTCGGLCKAVSSQAGPVRDSFPGGFPGWVESQNHRPVSIVSALGFSYHLLSTMSKSLAFYDLMII